MKQIKHNDLTHYFLRDHKDLPASYLRSCKEFFNTLNNNKTFIKNEWISNQIKKERNE
jgi:hypothetical protein